MPAPCGVPSTVSAYTPSSITPARSHSRMSLRMRRSAIRCAIIRFSQAWSTLAEEVTDVSIDNPVHPLRHDRRVDRPQRAMRAAVGRKPYEQSWKSASVDGVAAPQPPRLGQSYPRARAGRGPLPSVSLRDVGPQHRPRPILVRLEAGVERVEIPLQVALVRRHRHPIHAWRRFPPETPERSCERLDVQVVEQRREPGLARPLGRVVHPNEMAVPGPPALCLDRRVPARDPLWLGPSLRPARCPSPSSAVLRPDPPPCRPESQSSGLPRYCPPPVTKPEQPAGLPRFRWCLCGHDQVFDPGGPRSVSPLRRNRSCLRHLKQSRQPR